ncbi:hypothetical protein SHIRM173S_02508 [Streptomyces hirsutus]
MGPASGRVQALQGSGHDSGGASPPDCPTTRSQTRSEVAGALPCASVGGTPGELLDGYRKVLRGHALMQESEELLGVVVRHSPRTGPSGRWGRSSSRRCVLVQACLPNGLAHCRSRGVAPFGGRWAVGGARAGRRGWGISTHVGGCAIGNPLVHEPRKALLTYLELCFRPTGLSIGSPTSKLPSRDSEPQRSGRKSWRVEQPLSRARLSYTAATVRSPEAVSRMKSGAPGPGWSVSVAVLHG